MSLKVNWPSQWDADFVESLRSSLEGRLREALRHPSAEHAPIRGAVSVDKLDLGTRPPEITLRNVLEASATRTQLEVHVRYAGDACVGVSGVQLNLDLTSQGTPSPAEEEEDHRDRQLGDANHALPFFVNFTGRIVDVVIDGVFLVDIEHARFEEAASATASPAAAATTAARSPSRRSSSTVDVGSTGGPGAGGARIRTTRLPAEMLARRVGAHLEGPGGGDSSTAAHHHHGSGSGTPPADGGPLGHYGGASATPIKAGGAAAAARAVSRPFMAPQMGGGGMRSLLRPGGFAQSPGQALRDELRFSLAAGGTAWGHGVTDDAFRLPQRPPLTFAEMILSGKGTDGDDGRGGGVERTVRVRGFADPLQSLEVLSNFNTVVGDGLTKVLRSAVKPAIERLMSEGFTFSTGRSRQQPVGAS